MKAISLHQPWAWFAVHGFKPFETRSWHATPRGEILIHASQRIDEVGRHVYYNVRAEFGDSLFEPYHPPPFDELPRGCLVGIVNHDETINCPPELSAVARCLGDFSEGRWFFRFSNPRFFTTPIPARGHQRFWNHPFPSALNVQPSTI